MALENARLYGGTGEALGRAQAANEGMAANISDGRDLGQQELFLEASAGMAGAPHRIVSL